MIAEQGARDAARRCVNDEHATPEQYYVDEKVLYDWAIQELARRETEHAHREEFDARVERLLDCLRGSREEFRKAITDRDGLLRKVCHYAELEAKRIRAQPWSIIGNIMGHGSGVAAAIYELYRERKEGGER